MREILFRGKRLDNGEWIHGFFWKDIWGDGESCYILYDGENYPIMPSTMGRYTGLTDKNDAEIFEGDILHFINTYGGMNKEWLCVVVFYDGAFVCRYVEERGHFGNWNHFGAWNAPDVQWDVIGNIHDNSELLK